MMVLELQLDIMLMDLHLSRVNGILVLTLFGDDDSVFGAMHAGARSLLRSGWGTKRAHIFSSLSLNVG